MGITAEEVAAPLQRVAGRSGRVRRREPAPRRARRSQTARFKAEIVPVEIPQKKGEPIAFDDRRIPARRDDRREARGAEAGVQEGRHGHGRQRLGHQRRRRGARRRDGREGAADRRPRRWRGSWRTRRPASIPMVMGIGPVPAVRKALERAGLQHRRHRSVRAERSVRRAVARRRPRARRSIRRKVNVNGGAIALGHPIGASGARVLTTLIYALAGARAAATASPSLCIGGGMGIAMVIENLQLKS